MDAFFSGLRQPASVRPLRLVVALTRLLEGRVAGEGYAFLVEAVYHAHRDGLSVAEVPITFTDRREGQSKMSRKVIGCTSTGAPGKRSAMRASDAAPA